MHNTQICMGIGVISNVPKFTDRHYFRHKTSNIHAKSEDSLGICGTQANIVHKQAQFKWLDFAMAVSRDYVG